MLYSEIIAVYSEIHTKHINAHNDTFFFYFCPSCNLKKNTQRLRIARCTGSTRLDASFPEDGSRIRLRNFVSLKNLDDGESKERNCVRESSEPYSVYVHTGVLISL